MSPNFTLIFCLVRNRVKSGHVKKEKDESTRFFFLPIYSESRPFGVKKFLLVYAVRVFNRRRKILPSIK